MIEFVKSKLSGKRILILGFGKEGQSSFRLLQQIMPELYLGISDKNLETKNNDLLAGFNKERLHFGSDYLETITNYDILLKSPGVQILEKDNPNKIKICSQTSMFIEFYQKQIIGVTGTKGKSTTSSLIHFLITESGKKSVLLGNIGKPAFDSISQIDEETNIVFELSAHQLEYVSTSPHIAVLLNIFPEHLDYFQSFEKYKNTKMNINRFQTENDIFICLNSITDKMQTTATTYRFGFEDPNNAYSSANHLIFNDNGKATPLSIDNISLVGKHNQLNVMAAILAANASGIGFQQMFKVIKEFEGLPHRLEFVGKHGGIRYYNDSISTVPESTIEAIKTLKNVETIVLGGFDRGLNYSELAAFLTISGIKNFIFLGKAGDEILKQMNKISIRNSGIFEVFSLYQAFDIIKKRTSENGICLLSPAAASYDQFKNFEHRGDLFVELAVKK